MFRKRRTTGNVHESDTQSSYNTFSIVIASRECGTGRQIPSSRERGLHSASCGRLGTSLSRFYISIITSAGNSSWKGASFFLPALEIRQKKCAVLANLGVKLTPFGARTKGAGDWSLRSTALNVLEIYMQESKRHQSTDRHSEPHCSMSVSSSTEKASECHEEC
ncbi:hypothetical protein BDR22DRAFT_839725 [Usnea florida]